MQGMRFRRAVGGSVLISLFAGSAAGFAAGSLKLVSQVAPSQVSGTGAGSFNTSSRPPGWPPSLSDDGRYAVFHSSETNLVSGERDLNQGLDIFVQDLLTGTTSLVSHTLDSPAITSNVPSGEAAISGDGRWVAFTSRATDLVPGTPGSPVDSHRIGALYLYDRVADASMLVTNRPPYDFQGLAISSDGRYIAFTSEATDLVPGQRGVSGSNVFLYDRVARSFQLISHASASPTTTGSGSSRYPVLSADGRWVAFLSPADDLAPGNPAGDAAFLYDRVSGAVTRAGPAGVMALSADGRYLAVQGPQEAYLYDRATHTKTPLAADRVGDFSGDLGVAISADGRYVALNSPPSHLVPPQPGNLSASGLYLYDRISRTFTLVSRKHGSATTPGSAAAPRISADGRYVIFLSFEPDLVTGQIDPSGTWDVFLFDRDSGASTLVSRAGASATTAADFHSSSPVISADGTRVVFYSEADNLAAGVPDRNSSEDLFAYTIASTSLAAVSHHAPDLPSITPEADSEAAAVSGDGRWVVFMSYAVHLVAGQSGPGYDGDIFLYDRATRATILVSHAAGSLTRAANGSSSSPAITPDGRWVLFASSATDLVAGTTFSGSQLNYFLFDRLAGTTVLVGRTRLVNFPAPQARITPDGRWVVFASDAPNLVPGQQGHGDLNIYLWDHATGNTTLVSHSPAGPTVTSELKSYEPLISDDGSWIAFASLATDLVPGQIDGNRVDDLFLWDRTTGKTVLVSHAKGSPLTAGSLDPNEFPHPFAISADGRFIAFVSYAEIEGIDPGLMGGLYLYDRTTAALVRVADRAQTGAAIALAMSADGRYVAFSSASGPGVDPDGYDQVFLYDRNARTTTLLSRSISGDHGGNGGSAQPAISADGRYVAFTSSATDLVPGQPGPAHTLQFSVFLVDRLAGTTTWVSAPGTALLQTPDSSFHPLLSASGRQVAFTSTVDLVAGDRNNHSDAYLFSLDPPPAIDGPVAVPPCILFSGSLRSNARKVLKIAGSCGVPAGAKQVVVKLTVSQGTGKGNVQLYPGNVRTPAAGILRFERGATRAASFTLPLSTNGTGTIALLPFVAGNGTVRVAVEVNGYTP
jgi:Tol biopolymer transport system component